MYKLESNKKDYITATQRKYFKYALDFVLKRYKTAKDGSLKNEIINAVQVNKITFVFDFDSLTVNIKSNQDKYFHKHKLIAL